MRIASVLMAAVILGFGAFAQGSQNFLGLQTEEIDPERCIEISFDGQSIENLCDFAVVIQSVGFEGAGRDLKALDLRNNSELAAYGTQVSRSVLQDTLSFYGTFARNGYYNSASYPVISPRYRGQFLSRPIEYLGKVIALPECTLRSCDGFVWR